MFTAHVVFPGGPDKPTICSHTESSRLLLHRLKVLRAAMQRLAEFRSEAAHRAKKKADVAMKSFNTVLLVNTLRSIIAEIEQVDPNNAALAQLKFTLKEQDKRLTESRSEPSTQMRGAA